MSKAKNKALESIREALKDPYQKASLQNATDVILAVKEALLVMDVEVEAERVAHRDRNLLPNYDGALYDADPNCKHEVEVKNSGVGCRKCRGWFCY